MKNISSVFLLLFAFTCYAQQISLPVNIQTAYDKQTRSKDGKPGKNYWQNAASYDLKINFDPTSRLINGSEEIDYTNNSPDTLRNILFKLYPNLYKKGSIRLMSVKAEDLTDGVNISSIKFNNTNVEEKRINIDGTNMTVGGTFVAPKQKVHFSIIWSYCYSIVIL